jgi:hypothetical protein
MRIHLVRIQVRLVSYGISEKLLRVYVAKWIHLT